MTQQQRLYPIGIQTFSELITKNYLYIDKTEYVYRMTHFDSKYILNQSASYDTHIPSCLYIDNSWLSVLKKSVFLSDKAVVAGSFLILHYFAMANIKVSPQIA